MLDPDYRRFVERVKQAASIEEVVAQRVGNLKPAGALLKACCPFHDERTPSFVVTPARSTWHCFGSCGEGGDVIRFVEKFDGLSFKEAIEELARQYGIEIPKNTRAERKQNARELAALEALERAQRLYARKLKSPVGSAARAYLHGRGLSEAILDAFGVGYAPGGNVLVDAAKEAGFSDQALIDAGLAKQRQEGRLMDFFYNRIAIPIRDGDGRTLGFGARLLPGVEGPKYVNSSDSPVFHKGRIIFGLDLAREALRKERRVLLMEGYTDVMACHQIGLRTAVAVLGTATTAEHGRLIKRSGAKRATLLFDGDDAGRKAVLKALQGLLPLEGLSVDVVAPPEGLDPADLCQRDPARLKAALETPRSWFDFLLDCILPLEREQQAAGVRDLLRALRLVPSPVEFEGLLKAAALRLSLPLESLRGELQRLEPLPLERGNQRLAGSGSAARPGPEGATREAQGESAAADSRRRAPRRPAPRWEVEERAWTELLGALLVDNSLYTLHAELLRTAAEEPALRPASGQGSAVEAADLEAPASAADPAQSPGEPAPWTFDGDLGALVDRMLAARWGAPSTRLAGLIALAAQLLEDANPGEAVDLSLLLNYVEDDPQRLLLGRCETIGRRSQEGNQLGGPAELARGAARALEQVWSSRALELAEAALAAGDQEPDSEVRLRLQHLLIARRRAAEGSDVPSREILPPVAPRERPPERPSPAGREAGYPPAKRQDQAQAAGNPGGVPRRGSAPEPFRSPEPPKGPPTSFDWDDLL